MEEELEQIRKKKLQELQMSYQQRIAAEEEEKETEVKKQMILGQILTQDAKERLERVKIAKPELAENVENQLILLLQNGRLNQQIDDNSLKMILRKIGSRREIRIERR
ncbi:MAG: DNA-binding protein [Candidatus Thermoplasmatota archaeon]|nr:DNA-binding protein [Candidatus Thermoplasmatota archaeon]MBU4256094.1 DNA-binding protein [Candidatus Thermoplasmatota archaeon]MCG2825542.1 DNA-binding protein [Thermoplasmatales archaeon]